MVLGTCILSIIAIVWGACVHSKLGKLSKGVVIFNAVVLILTIIGLWFKMAHYPGGTVIFILCFSGLLPASVIWTAISYMKRNK